MTLLNRIRAAITKPAAREEWPAVKMYISTHDNQWNKLAILLAGQSDVLPSKRKQFTCIVPENRYSILAGNQHLSTSEWNKKALSVVENEACIT